MKAPTAASVVTTKVMRANKSKNTKPELLLRQSLRQSGVTGYRLHWKVAGKPDIAFPGKKIAVFVHGCFWHDCPKCKKTKPRANAEYWKTKLERNVQRHEVNKAILLSSSWEVLEIWECEIKAELSKCVERITNSIRDRK